MDFITIEVEENEGRWLNIGGLWATLERVNDKGQAKGKRHTIGVLPMVVILAKSYGEDTPWNRRAVVANCFRYHEPSIHFWVGRGSVELDPPTLAQ